MIHSPNRAQRRAGLNANAPHQIRVAVQNNSVILQLIGPAGIGTQIAMSPRMTLGIIWVMLKATWLAWRHK